MIVKKAGTVLLNIETKQIGLIYRQKKNDYSFPKGHLEEGETLQECAVRETEEETLRANHLYSDEEIATLRYITPAGEDTESHVYLAIDDGPTTKEIPLQDREKLQWFSPDDVEEILSYDNLKDLWNKIKGAVLKILDL